LADLGPGAACALQGIGGAEATNVRALSGSFGVRQAFAVDTVNAGLAMDNRANELAVSPRRGRWLFNGAAHQGLTALGWMVTNSWCRLVSGVLGRPGYYRNGRFWLRSHSRRRLTVYRQAAAKVVLATGNFDHIGSMGVFVHWHKPFTVKATTIILNPLVVNRK
jgi:hypothetical protein